MLSVSNIEVAYHSVILVLHGVSLEVGDKEMVALLGANGAGKTTTLKAISGLLRTEVGEVTKGEIRWNARGIDRLGPEEVSRMGIIQVLEGRRVLEHLTVEENLRVAHQIVSGVEFHKSLDSVYHYFPRLRDLRRQTAGYISGGEQQMLVVGRAVMAHPKLMLLDEPSLGLAPLLVKEIFDIVQRINSEEGTAILLVEQNAMAALNMVNRGYVVESGRVVLSDSAENLRSNEDVREFYLGYNVAGKAKSYRDVKHYKRRKRWLG